MSKTPTSPYGSDPHQAAQARAAQAKAHARASIEAAIAVLQTHQKCISDGQAKAIKRILYNCPYPSGPTPC